jgi:spermidine/putrescine transport system permease protein
MRAFGNQWLLWTAAAIVMLFLYAPILVMMFFSVNDSQYTGLPFNGFSLRWYHTLFSDKALLQSIWNSVYVGLGVVVISTLFGLPAALALDRFEFPGKTFFRRLVMIPIVMPGIITGVALLIFYLIINLKLSLYTIMLGQGTGLMCIMITEVFARLQQVGRSNTEAATNLGASDAEVFFKVTLPSIRSALIGAMLIVFSISFDEIAVTYLLTGRENTLPMTLWSLLRREVTPEINAVATLVVVASIVLIVVGIWMSRGAETADHSRRGT